MASTNIPFKRKLLLVAQNYGDLGFTAFGGPPVHFQILYQRFVTKLGWIDDKAYNELFAVSQSLPGPASTKLAFSICLSHLGFVPALLAFAFWSLPGAIGMYGLSVGVARVQNELPTPVYYLLSGLNAATVGLVAQAGMQLSTRAITDGLSRTILIFTACAGLCYTALWYFPVIMVAAGVIAAMWDLYLRRSLFLLGRRIRRMMRILSQPLSRSRTVAQPNVTPIVEMPQVNRAPSLAIEEPVGDTTSLASEASTNVQRGFTPHIMQGLIIIGIFFALFITSMVLRSVLKDLVELRLFTNMFLAGTIIFGGGPVVIPLLREYVVQEGWVSSRDFLIGLAIIQSFPGPNFNFAVFLGALTASSTRSPSWATAILGFIGIFFPGLMLVTGMSSIWPRLRRYQVVTSCIRGINAAAVGLIWTAVYRLWEAGNLTHSVTGGQSLGLEPWWLVVAAVAFSGQQWYGVPAPVCIIGGGVLGIARWGVTQ